MRRGGSYSWFGRWVGERGGWTKICFRLIITAAAAPGAGWRPRPVDAAQTGCPHPYGAGAQDQILKSRPFRRDLLFCAARPGVPLHAGTAETYRFRPATSWGRVQSAGAAILRMDGRTQRGFIYSWDCWRYAPRIGIKKGARCQPLFVGLGNLKSGSCPAPLSCPAKI